jgi:putative oxidoreductase
VPASRWPAFCTSLSWAPGRGCPDRPAGYGGGGAALAVRRGCLPGRFGKKGILKWNGFLQLSDPAIYLFPDEFKLHLPGGPYDFPAPAVMAFLSGSGEIIFPLLLVLGLRTRFGALGLLFMTGVVELTVPDGWPIHITWAAMALAIMAWGPGRRSIDYALCLLPGLRVKEAASS